MNGQQPPIFRRPCHRLLLLPLGLLLWALVLWPVPSPAGAEEGESPHEHAAHGDHHPAPSAASDSSGKDHEHPVLDPSAADEVGLKERLGETIPLDLTFSDEEGKPVLLRDLVTGPTIIVPVYYQCPNVCNFLQADLARTLPQVKMEPGKDYRVLSVSFDDRETPIAARAARKTYLTAMNADYPQEAWRFLTGKAEAIRALTDAAGYHFLRKGDDFLHPVAFFVVSREGRIARYLHGTHVLPMDLTLALTEAGEGRVGTTIRKVVSFCFSFDPEKKKYVFNYLRIVATVVMLTGGAFLAFLVLGGRKR